MEATADEIKAQLERINDNMPPVHTHQDTPPKDGEATADEVKAQLERIK